MPHPRKEFSKIFNKYIDKIYRFIFLKVNSEDIAKDICSETFLRGWGAYKKANNPGPKEARSIENPQAFLYKIARNLVTDYYREKGRTQVVSAEFAAIIDPRPGAEESAFFASDLDQVKAALANLNEDYQNIIVWHYLDDLPIKEVARMMDKSEETARVTLHRALKALKNELIRTA